MIPIICPLCRQLLDRGSSAWRCASGHSFDVAREGYVNLLAVQHKKSRAPGDNAAMVKARREFLDTGHYQGLRDAVSALLAPLHARSLLDLGCGEGYYTTALAQVAGETIGVDIAKPAIQAAAKRVRSVTWLVASGALLPVADASVEVVACLFTQLHAAETQRVLAPGGHLLVATPAADHLQAMRERLFDEVRPHHPAKLLAVLEPQFELRDQQTVRFDLRLEGAALGNLLTMTPYAWRATPEKRAALEAGGMLETQAAFSLMLLGRR